MRDEKEIEIQMVARMVTAHKRDLDDVASTLSRLSKRVDGLVDDAKELKFRLGRLGQAVEYKVGAHERRLERVEGELTERARRLSEITADVYQLKGIDQERSRHEATGQHKLVDIQASLRNERAEGHTTVRQAMASSAKVTLAIVAILSAAVTGLIQWLLKD